MFGDNLRQNGVVLHNFNKNTTLTTLVPQRATESHREPQREPERATEILSDSLLGNTSQKKECFLSGIVRITPPP